MEFSTSAIGLFTEYSVEIIALEIRSEILLFASIILCREMNFGRILYVERHENIDA